MKSVGVFILCFVYGIAVIFYGRAQEGKKVLEKRMEEEFKCLPDMNQLESMGYQRIIDRHEIDDQYEITVYASPDKSIFITGVDDGKHNYSYTVTNCNFKNINMIDIVKNGLESYVVPAGNGVNTYNKITIKSSTPVFNRY